MLKRIHNSCVNFRRVMIGKLKNKAGYVSIETIMVAGLIIGLGAMSISNFQASANTVTQRAIDKVNTAIETGSGG